MKPLDVGKDPGVRELVRAALREDIGPGDATSEALVPDEARADAVIVARGSGVAAGLPVAELVFREADARIAVRLLKRDGESFGPSDVLMRLRGPARGILAAERVALNFLQRLTGIATLTRRFADRARPHGVAILDTRKTTPGLRRLEKYAVQCGGGQNHRMGLYDRVLIKDNHRAFRRKTTGGSPAELVSEARAKRPDLEIEVEVESIEELRGVLPAKPDWVLLDNMTPSLIRDCVAVCRGACRIEASGGISLDNVEDIARAGVDAISVGALTHSAPAADLSLEFSDESSSPR